jgi:hypothetical protein
MSKVIGQQPIEKLIQHLEGAIEIRSGVWKARCPGHEDRSPSLSIKEVDDGVLLIYCHAGCSVSEVVSTVGLQVSDLYPPDPYIESMKRRRNPPKNYRLVVERSRWAALICAVYADHIKKHWNAVSDVLDLDEQDLIIFTGVTEDLMELLND